MHTIYFILINIIIILLSYLYIVYYKYYIKKEIDNLKDHVLYLDGAFINQNSDLKKLERQSEYICEEIKIIFNEIDKMETKPNQLNFINKLSKELDELRTLVSDNTILIQMDLKDMNNKIFKNGINK